MGRRWITGLSVLAVGAVVLVGCDLPYARAGARCTKVGSYAQDESYILKCERSRRWVRGIRTAKADAALAFWLASLRPTPVPSIPSPVTPPPLPPPPPPPPPPPVDPQTSFQAVLALPSDVTADPGWLPGIVHEVGVVSNWFAGQTGGRRPRINESGGVPTVITVALPMTRAQVESSGFNAAMQTVLSAVPAHSVPLTYLGANRPSGGACGDTRGIGGSAIGVNLYMYQCSIFPKSTSAFPYEGTYLLAHEMTHALGAVPSCASHFKPGGHVGDDPRDVVYDGVLARDWLNITLDPGHDDYFMAGRPECPGIDGSPLWAS